MSLFSFGVQPSRGHLLTLAEIKQNSRGDNYNLFREKCSNAYLGHGTSLCRVLGRYKMQVDTNDVGLSSHLLLDGVWEMWVVELLLDRIKPGMTVADAGANLGYFTLLMSDLVGEQGCVHAFEPNPALAERLRASLAINGFHARTVVHELGLSDEAGEAALTVPATEPKNGHVTYDMGREGVVPIQLQRLDALDGLQDLDFIKIDVEGSEERLWTGMKGILERDRPLTILLEFTGARYADAGAFLDQIMSYGFKLEHLTLAQGVVPLTAEELLSMPGNEDQMILLSR